jgi:predicted secreted protein
MLPKATCKFIALFALCGASYPVSAGAGDYAERSLLGFSPDGRYFAFEEYGIQDGSGFPYSNIYLIDTSTDAWVEGTPIRVLVEGESPPLSETRQQSADRFRPFLIEHRIGATGTIVAANPLTETSADPHHVSFLPLLLVPSNDRDYELSLREYELPAPGCPDMGQPYKGFQLTMIEPSGRQRTLARDERIPGSRNCPLSYAISEVITYYPPNRQPVFAAIISMLSVGFEGPDRRFLAVTGQI